MSKQPASFDPKKHFASVPTQRGKVQQDSDWNEGGAGRSRGRVRRDSDWNSGGAGANRGRRRWRAAIGVGVIVLAAAVGGLLLARRYGPLLAFRALSGPVANLVTPWQGSVVALHSTVGVTGEGTSGNGVRELQLWVNGQQWASKVFDVPPDKGSATWGWTPSGEGEHLLVVKVISATGETAESETVHVLAAMAADVRFPMTYAVEPGDSLETVAQNYETSVQDIVDSNPGLDPTAPLSPGQPLTVPVPVPNQPEAFPEGGFDPAPPAGEAKPAPGATLPETVSDYMQAVGPQVDFQWRDFQLLDGKLTPNQPVEKIYFYVSVDDAHWQRIPADEHSYLFAPTGVFDLKPLLQPILDQAGGASVKVALEVWAWRDGSLVFLGSYYGSLSASDAGPQLLPSGSTDLQAVDYVYLGIKHYTKALSITAAQPAMGREFHWTSSGSGVTYGLWQVSTQAFPPGTSLNPPGLIHQGISNAGNGTFTLDFGDYFTKADGDFFDAVKGVGDFVNQAVEGALGSPPPTKTFSFWQPRFFLVRVIPMSGSPLSGDPAAKIAGPASNPVFVWYQPFGNPYKPNLDPNGPAYQATILSFEPYRPADPKYSACMLLAFEYRDCTQQIAPGQDYVSSLQYSHISAANAEELFKKWGIPFSVFQTCPVTIPQGTQSCGCPGVSCSSGGCGWNLACHAAKGFEALAGAFGEAWDYFSGLYNDAVAFVKEWAAKLNPLCIQAKLAAKEFGDGSVTEEDVADVCQAATDIAVTAVQIYFGLPPSLPDSEQFVDEGLDYAISLTASQMGIDCNAQCVALLKKGFTAAASGENLLSAGMDVGASMAIDELSEAGYKWCDAKCRNLIHLGVWGKDTLAELSDTSLEQAAQQIANNLNASGYPCDQGCLDVLKKELKAGAAVGQTAAASAAQPKQVLLYQPDPRGVDQPAIVRVSIFRRFESASVPQEDLAHCGLQIFSYAANTVNGIPITGSPFAAQGLELPFLAPGKSVTIPIVLDKHFGTLPDAVMAFLSQQAQAAAPPPSNDPNVIYASVIDPWGALYFGSNLQIKATGPAFITTAGGGQALPCVAEDTWSTLIPAP
jgi:LysM repeat protein